MAEDAVPKRIQTEDALCEEHGYVSKKICPECNHGDAVARQKFGIKERIGFIRNEMAQACPSVRPNDREWILALMVTEVEAAYQAGSADMRIAAMKAQCEGCWRDWPYREDGPIGTHTDPASGGFAVCQSAAIRSLPGSPKYRTPPRTQGAGDD